MSSEEGQQDGLQDQDGDPVGHTTGQGHQDGPWGQDNKCTLGQTIPGFIEVKGLAQGPNNETEVTFRSQTLLPNLLEHTTRITKISKYGGMFNISFYCHDPLYLIRGLSSFAAGSLLFFQLAF